MLPNRAITKTKDPDDKNEDLKGTGTEDEVINIKRRREAVGYCQNKTGKHFRYSRN